MPGPQDLQHFEQLRRTGGFRRLAPAHQAAEHRRIRRQGVDGGVFAAVRQGRAVVRRREIDGPANMRIGAQTFRRDGLANTAMPPGQRLAVFEQDDRRR